MTMKGNLGGAIRLKFATNLVLGILIFSIGALCLSPMQESVSAKTEQGELYRYSDTPQGVSLMFNVYWGTDEVYRILTILSEYDAKATFFIGGCWADDNVDCLKAIHVAGHELGNHGYFHKDHAGLTLAENQREINECNRFIQLSIGVQPTLFAPPSGAYDERTIAAAQSLGMSTILWSKDTIDWRDKDKSVVIKRATTNLENGDLILMHPKEHTLSALPDILSYYKSVGFSVVTVSENIV